MHHVISMPALTAHPNFGLESFSHHQTHDENVLLSDVYTH